LSEDAASPFPSQRRGLSMRSFCLLVLNGSDFGLGLLPTPPPRSPCLPTISMLFLGLFWLSSLCPSAYVASHTHEEGLSLQRSVAAVIFGEWPCGQLLVPDVSLRIVCILPLALVHEATRVMMRCGVHYRAPKTFCQKQRLK
jgi:hypothetical protein